MKKGVIVLRIIVLLSVLCTFIVQVIRIKALKKKTQVQAVELMHYNDSVKSYKTKTGEAFFKLNSVIIESNTLKGSLEAMGIENKDLKLKDINSKNLIMLLKEQIESTGHTGPIPLMPVSQKDSAFELRLKKFVWPQNVVNAPLILNGLIEGAVKNTKIKEIDYVYKTGIIHHTERLGNKSVVTVSLTDANGRISDGSQIVIEPVNRWWDKWYFYVIAGLGTGVFLAK